MNIEDASTMGRSQISGCFTTIHRLELLEKERQARQDSMAQSDSNRVWPPLTSNGCTPAMSPGEYARYGRQMILPSFGLPTQLKLRRARVLVVGAGGLGCPAIQYLAACGVGHITVVDHDVVERSNLSRQILHSEGRVGMAKVESVKIAVGKINPFVTVAPVQEALTTVNALHLVESHDLVLDCTDNPLTRYLISDTAVICDKMVVSGAGQGYEGQLVVLHRGASCGSFTTIDERENRGPCYRCLYPVAPKPEEVKDCAETGVLGIVTGLVGTLQATEAIKLLTGLGCSDGDDGQTEPATMLLINPLESTHAFRTFRLRARQKTCRACGDEEACQQAAIKRITAENLQDEDYVSFCGLNRNTDDASQADRSGHTTKQMTVGELAQMPVAPRLLLDVRTREEFSIVRLEGSINMPYSEIRRHPDEALKKISRLSDTSRPAVKVHCLCLKGNDSLLAAKLLNRHVDETVRGLADGQAGDPVSSLEFIDVQGGLREWRRIIDLDLPEY